MGLEYKLIKTHVMVIHKFLNFPFPSKAQSPKSTKLLFQIV